MFRKFICVLLLLLLAASIAIAEPVVNKEYVFLDWKGAYTGQADSNSIPFGFGVFISEMPMEGELWHYVGQWVDGLPEGEGTLYFENGSMQKGIFTKGILTDGYSFTVTGMTAIRVKIEKTRGPENKEPAYIGNKNSKKFHIPTCKSVTQMKEKNRVEFFSREEAIAMHYTPCGDCNP